jgi:hypothetical protein
LPGVNSQPLRRKVPKLRLQEIDFMTFKCANGASKLACHSPQEVHRHLAFNAILKEKIQTYTTSEKVKVVRYYRKNAHDGLKAAT